MEGAGRREIAISVRFLIVSVLLLTALVALLLVLLATDTALSVWQQLSERPLWVRWAYGGGLALITALVTFLVARWLWPRQGGAPVQPAAEVSEALIEEQLAESRGQGMDISEAEAELAEQQRRKQSGAIHISLFGEVSTGKSALVRALLPQAEAESDARAGTTTRIRHYEWTAPSGDRILIADLPGINLGDDPLILEEARRAHLVVYLCDSDLSRSQADALQQLQSLDKPLLVALNKADRYSSEELTALRERIVSQTGIDAGRFATVSAGGREAVIRELADGSQQAGERDRPADVEALRQAIQRLLDRDADLMETLRDNAVLLLAAEKLYAARQSHRAEQADALVQTYSRRAVIGALAAVAPGSDLVIQGVLATRLLQELCALYGVSAKDMQIESFLKLAGGKVRKMSALTLAIAGNGLKAFPGVGTLSGGLLHAVAYGMIFDSLGRAAADTLATRGDLRPLPAAQAFGERLNDHLESGAGHFARLALKEFRHTDGT